MPSQKLYFRQDIQVEPLFNSWVAWVLLIPPATAAMNMVERHIAIMTSYINSPELHALALKNPAMQSGPFIALDRKRIDEIENLLQNTKKYCGHLINFVSAIKELETLLSSQAKGYSLESLYSKVPEILQGYVELNYDLNNNATFRFFEALLYRSNFYDVGCQSIALSKVEQDSSRPFIFSTPRLKSEKSVHLPIPFAHQGLDELFKMKKNPQTYDWIRSQLGVEIQNEELLASFFTENPPQSCEKYADDGVRVRYFGHACLLLETKDVSILFDPIVSYVCESGIPRYTYQDLPEWIDYVLITHSHQDHFLPETLMQLRHKVGQIVVGRNYEGALQDPSLALMLKHIGFKNIIEMREMDEITIPGGVIVSLPFLGEHHDLLVRSKLSYLIQLLNRSILVLADSCNIDTALYHRIHLYSGDVDLIFLGMECDGSPPSWVYGPLFNSPLPRVMDRSRLGRGCNYAEGMQLVEIFHPQEVYVYAMGQEPWLRYILGLELEKDSNPIIQSQQLIAECKSRGIVSEFLFGERDIFL
ncbi:MAG: MBL fold metallo-hydrolase [Cyanomargarita calcarea GSE-NOS-MK-12-04C]|jgi:L-ascorbate metabolism protein UlaG (beta-lactamase superfamily)|uniref:MBL fold metallo-hydrolase n=1 Tax=Cyanomargarita calcarea GSE-NOS-MK-12-04C TaxID=2839659 RepID=A0A951QL40_9CYAN|nr:MBL fold metallo-hydrolase [Cyanomargarita calcarea GSE-NOS-MK-12-04C]